MKKRIVTLVEEFRNHVDVLYVTCQLEIVQMKGHDRLNKGGDVKL